MKLGALVLVVLSASGAAAAEGNEGFAIATEGSAKAVAVGQSGKLVLALKPLPPWHVDPKAPLKIRIEPPAGLTFARTALARKDAVDPAAETPRWEAPFQAVQAGSVEATAHLKFFLCRESICESRTAKVVFPVAVK